MRLSKIERVLLAEQYRILAKIDPDNAELYAHNCKVLENGYELYFDSLDERFKAGVSRERCIEVLRILTMFDALDESYRRIKGDSAIRPEAIRFRGFDKDDEEDLLGYAQFVLYDEGQFSTLKREDLNSGSSMLAIYRRMLREWDKSREKNRLTEDDMQRIERARIEQAEPSEDIWQSFAPRGFPPPISLVADKPKDK
jgi:uncharacterized protein YfbU (UPF0304 family)